MEVECSGVPLDSGTDVLGIALYTSEDRRVLAYVNMKNSMCSSRGTYSACVLDHADTRRTRLIMLVTDLAEGEVRVYGCNITSFRSGVDVHQVSWSLAVKLESITTRFIHVISLLIDEENDDVGLNACTVLKLAAELW